MINIAHLCENSITDFCYLFDFFCTFIEVIMICLSFRSLKKLWITWRKLRYTFLYLFSFCLPYFVLFVLHCTLLMFLFYSFYSIINRKLTNKYLHKYWTATSNGEKKKKKKKKKKHQMQFFFVAQRHQSVHHWLWHRHRVPGWRAAWSGAATSGSIYHTVGRRGWSAIS